MVPVAYEEYLAAKRAHDRKKPGLAANPLSRRRGPVTGPRCATGQRFHSNCRRRGGCTVRITLRPYHPFVAIEVTTQKAMADVARGMKRCYICGGSLSPDSGNGRVTRDHVIPKAMLGPQPAAERDRWSVILPVHERCEDVHKEHRDQFAKILQVMGARGSAEWSPEETNLFFKVASVQLADGGPLGPIPVIRFHRGLELAPWLWARGLHATLYRSVLPEGMKHYTGAPVPLFASSTLSVADPLRDERNNKDFVLSALRTGMKFGTVDVVRAWGGNVLYRCVWLRHPDRDGEPWSCVWALESEGTQDWAMSVRGEDTPWHGFYELPARPAEASVVTHAQIERYNEFIRSLRAPSVTLPLLRRAGRC